MIDATDDRTAHVPAPVRAAGDADTQLVVETLALAFADDPVVSWAIRDDERRPAALRKLFALEVAAAMPHREVHLTGDNAGGVAVWFPPGDSWRTDQADLAQVVEAMAEISGEARRHRPLSLAEAMEQAHPAQPHRYLHWLGVAPGVQGHGVGSALLRGMLERCDAEGLPAYLEATNPRNVRLYARHGFVVTEELRLPDDCPPLWLMWREPAATTA